MHVGMRHQSVQPGERRPVEDFIFGVGRGGQSRRSFVAGTVGHLFDSGRQDNFRHPGTDFDDRLTERYSARRAGRLDVRRRNAGHTEIVGHQRADVLLPNKQSAGHATDVHGIDVVDPGVGNRRPGRIDI